MPLAPFFGVADPSIRACHIAGRGQRHGGVAPINNGLGGPLWRLPKLQRDGGIIAYEPFIPDTVFPTIRVSNRSKRNF